MAQLSKERNDTHFFGVALTNPKNGFNIGAAVRACGAFNSSFLVSTGNRYKERNSDFRNMDTEFARKRMPVFIGVDSFVPFIPHDVQTVCIERKSESINLSEFRHPRRAIYVFGPEDGQTEDYEYNHSVFIPSLDSLNLAASVYIVLYDRMSKMHDFIVEEERCRFCGSNHLRTNNELEEDGSKIIHCNACGKDSIIT